MSGTGEVDHADAGTTLIEALAVVAITTMIALVGFPRLQQSLVTLAQRQTVSVVAARLRQARADALRGDTAVIFSVSADGRSYGATVGGYGRTPPGVTVNSGGGPAITFGGDGSSRGGQVLITGGRRTIAVSVASPGGDIAVGPG